MKDSYGRPVLFGQPTPTPGADQAAAKELIAHLEQEAERRNNAYDRWGMNNTAETVNPLAYTVARAYLAQQQEIELHRLNDEIVKLLTPEERAKYGPSVVAKLQAAEQEIAELRRVLELIGEKYGPVHGHQSAREEDCLTCIIAKALARKETP